MSTSSGDSHDLESPGSGIAKNGKLPLHSFPFPHFFQKFNYLQKCQVCSSLDHYSQNKRDFCTPHLN